MRPTSSAKHSSCLFKRDDEFKRWLGEHPNNINQQQIRRRRSYKDRVDRHEASFNQIRRAREYSVLKTACPALCSALVSGSIRSKSSPASQEDVSLLSASSPQESSSSLRTMPRIYGGHRGRKRRKPPSDCPRSSQAIAGSCVLGLRTHAKAILGANTMLPAWKVLAFPAGRSAGVGRVPTA